MRCSPRLFLPVSLVLLACGQPPAPPATMPPPTPTPPAMQPEKKLDVKLVLTDKTLKITVRDDGAPVMTDLWLYTLEGGGVRPLTAFAEASSSRKSRRRMMPCKLAGASSTLWPCDEGEENGIMTDTVREQIDEGETSSAINGEVEVVLAAAPTTPIVVVAAIEDQRYAGAGAIDVAGKAVSAPAGLGVPVAIKKRSYEKDVAPLLTTLRCTGCHGPGGPAAFFRLKSYEDIVERNFAYEEEKEACATEFPADEQKRLLCEKEISAVEYMIERGAPALSPFLRRTRPDEMKSISDVGLKWYGSGGKRFGGRGDRRMPPQNISADTADDMPNATHFDNTPADFQLLFDWVAQGAPR